MRKSIILLVAFLLPLSALEMGADEKESCYIATATLDVKPFVNTAIDDFLTQKEAGSSDVFSVLDRKSVV